MTLALTIVPVETRGQLQRFVRLPRRLYRGLPGFVPPLDLERRGMLSKHAAFFTEGRARYFLAMRGRRCVGRVSAQVSPLALRHWGDGIGLFGAIDAVDDQPVVTALLAAASAWLREQGMQVMRGPFLLSSNGESGLLVQGHTERAMLMSPWHPPYLGGLVEAAGLRKVKDLVSYELAIGSDAEAALPVGRVRLQEVGGGRLSVRKLRLDRLEDDAAIMGRLFNDAWHGNWGFVPITDQDLAAMVKELRPLIRPEHLVMVERDGEPVGFALVLPNIYDVVADLGGSPGPIGWIRLGVRLFRHRFRSGRVVLLGVSASLRNTTLGAMMPSLIIAELMRRGRTMPLRTVELGWVLEDNTRMRRLIERLSPQPCKVFRVYERAVG